MKQIQTHKKVGKLLKSIRRVKKTRKLSRTIRKKNKYTQSAGSNEQELYNRYHSFNAIKEPEIRNIEIRNNNNISNTLIKNNVIDSLRDKFQKINKTIINNSTYSLTHYYFNIHNPQDVETQDITISKMKSGNCVAFAHMILDALSNEGIKTGKIIPATLPSRLKQDGYPYYGHVAVMLETKTKFILFEPAYFILTPIYVPKDETPVTINVKVFNADWTFKYDKKTKQITVLAPTKTNELEQLFYYVVAEIVNPSVSVSYPINVLNKRIPIVKYDADTDTKIAHLSIRIDTKALEGYSNTNPTDKGWFQRLEWKTLLDGKKTESEVLDALKQWPGLSDDLCKKLGYTNPNELRKHVYAIIASENEKATQVTQNDLIGGNNTYDDYWF